MTKALSAAIAVTDALSSGGSAADVFRAVFENEFEEAEPIDILPGRTSPGLLLAYTRGEQAFVRCDVTGLKLAMTAADPQTRRALTRAVDYWMSVSNSLHERDIREVALPCAWRRSPEPYIRLGLYGLYAEHDEDPSAFPGQPILIELLSTVSDRCRYSACCRLVADQTDENARTIMRSLMVLRYNPANTIFDALEMLWIYCLLFKPVDLPPLSELLRPIYESELNRGRFDPARVESVLLEFCFKYTEALRPVALRRNLLSFPHSPSDPLSALISKVTVKFTQ